MPSGAVWQAGQAWSNDGTRIVAIRGYSGGNEQSRAVALPVDGSGAGVEINYPGAIQQGCCTAWEWAPDDTWILGTPTNAAGAALDQVRLDPISGGSGTVTWKGRGSAFHPARRALRRLAANATRRLAQGRASLRSCNAAVTRPTWRLDGRGHRAARPVP